MINTVGTVTVVTLILVLSLFYLEPASAEITIDGEIIRVETDAYTVQFDGGVITYIHNKFTDETYTLSAGAGKQAWSGLLNHRHFWNDANISTRSATLISARKIDPLKAELLFRQGGTEIRLFIAVDPMTDDLLIDIEGVSDTPGVVGMQWGVGDLDIQNLSLIVPVYGGRVIDATTLITSTDRGYPSIWEAQLAIVQAQRGGFFVRCTDDTFQFKRFIYDRQNDGVALNFTTFNQAPFDSHTTAESMRWRFNTYTGDWRVPARIYRDWMDKAFQPRRLSDMPAWVEDIALIIDGINVEYPEVLNKLAELVDPTKTLLKVSGAFGGRDWWKPTPELEYYPDYVPKPELGQFLEAAHRHGFRVMPYVNLLGFSPHHPRYPEFEPFQYRTPWTGESVGWVWDTTSTHRHAYINPASSAFRKIIVQEFQAVWQQYPVDAFFLDVSHLVVNDANGLIEGLNSAQGNALLHKELADAMPGVAFGGERLHEVSFFRESFAQRPLLTPEIEPHPISAFLFSPYTHAIGGASLPNPEESPVSYQQHVSFHERWGILPTLRAWSVNQLDVDRTETQRLLSIARTWQQFGLKPDFESDWSPGTLFQYIGQGGEIAAYQRTTTGSILTLPQGGVGYESVSDTTQATTDQHLPGWHAYNETTLFGLDPNKSYLLSDTPRDLSQPRINALSDGVLITEARVTENAALFRLEDTVSSYEIDLSAQLRRARTGIETNGSELPLQKGASFGRAETTIAGVSKEGIVAHPPWREGIRGNAFGEWTLTLPDSPSISFAFYIGLPDSAIHSDGVTFIVSVQGDEIFQEHHTERRWRHVELDLTRYQGQQVTLRLTTTPGPNGHTGQDSARWGEPKIVSERVGAQIGFFLSNPPIRSFPDTVRYIGQGQYTLDTELPAQVLFLFKTARPVVLSQNLIDTPYTAGLQFEGIFLDGSSAWGSGQREWTTIAGVSKPSIGAHPPDDGQTVIQFLLSLPQAKKITFSFSMGLRRPCTTGVKFQVRLNGHPHFEHATSRIDWTDAELSLSTFAGEPVLLELITDPDGLTHCDAAAWADLLITAEAVEPNGDVNRDGQVNVLDLILIAQSFGKQPPDNPQADVNSDGVVNVMDLVFVVKRFSQNAAAPSQLDLIKSIPSTSKEIIAAHRALSELEALPNKSQGVQLAIELLRHYLSVANQRVEETKLLPNYPNPFNPETWIPYQLSEGSTVTVKIYDVSGSLVRTIGVGHKSVGYCLTREKAVYWDGRNGSGEPVGSGVYFYTLITDDYTQTRRMVIVK